MKSSTKDQAEGKYHEVKGKIKEIAGKLSDNPKLEAEGTGEKIAGKVQGKIGEVKKVFERIVRERRIMHKQACPRAPGCGCMIHHSEASERQEVFGAKMVQKQL